MTSLRPTRILVVANRTAAAPRLLREVTRRAQGTRCEFVLLIPDAGRRRDADWTLAGAVALLQRAAHGPVEGMVSDPDAWTSVQTVVATGDFDEIIVSTRPRRLTKWLRRDLASRVRGLGLPVTAIGPVGGMSSKEAAKMMLEGVGTGDRR